VQVTVVAPTENIVPEVGAQDTGTEPSTKSIAVGIAYETPVPKDRWPGHDIGRYVLYPRGRGVDHGHDHRVDGASAISIICSERDGMGTRGMTTVGLTP